MRFHLISLFPTSFPGPLGQSVLGRGQKEGLFSLCVHDLRKFGQGSNLMVDDSPYGGGPGMVIKPEPVSKAIDSVSNEIASDFSQVPIVLLDPRGQTFNQTLADELAAKDEMVTMKEWMKECGKKWRQSL
jgi:tRNA (guanine37-N1)-methyltransferase